jgi:hypothetical protein
MAGGISVGKLSIDLEAGTYQYTSALDKAGADAEKAAGRIKGSFDKVDFKEARGGMMLFGDLVGVHLPRHVTSFIASMGPVGAVMEAAFPFLAIAVGAVVLIEHLTKLKETAEKLETDTAKFETTIHTTFNAWDDRLLEAQKKADELSGNHLGALEKELTLIDHASMKELMQTFDQLATAVDAVFKDMKSHWYNISLGSEGAQHALGEFKKEYDLLLAEGKDKEAGDLLKGTLDSANKAKRELEEIKRFYSADTPASEKTAAEFERVESLKRQYQAQTYKGTLEQIEAQDRLLEVLNATAAADAKRVETVKQLKDNALTGEANRESNEQFKKFKEEQREQEREDREREEAYRQAVQRIQDGEKDKIEATKAGSRERLAAIDAAILEEQHKGFQETNYFKELGRMRSQLILQMAEDEARARAEAGRIAAEHDIKMAELGAAAELEELRHRQATRRRFFQSDLADATETENKEFDSKKKAIEKEIAALDQGDKQYQNKKKALQNKEVELEQAHQNKLTTIRDKAMEHMADQFQKTFNQMNSELENFVTTGQFSFGRLAQGIITQIMDMALQYGESKLMMIAMDKLFGAHKGVQNVAEAESNTAVAATEALASVPWPFNIAAAAETEALGQGFTGQASVGIYEKGGLVPQNMPAFLHANEMVLPANIARHVMATAGGGGGHTSISMNPTFNGQYNEKEMMRVMDRWAERKATKRGHRWN